MTLQICGRGKSNFDHIGNRRLRVLIACDLPAYMQVNRRATRSKILQKIVHTVQDAGGRFVRYERKTNRWSVMDDAGSVRKVCHVINYGLHKSGKNGGTPPRNQIQALQNHLLWSALHPSSKESFVYQLGAAGPTSARGPIGEKGGSDNLRAKRKRGFSNHHDTDTLQPRRRPG